MGIMMTDEMGWNVSCPSVKIRDGRLQGERVLGRGISRKRRGEAGRSEAGGIPGFPEPASEAEQSPFLFIGPDLTLKSKCVQKCKKRCAGKNFMISIYEAHMDE